MTSDGCFSKLKRMFGHDVFMSESVFCLFFGRLDSFLSVVFPHCRVSIRLRLDEPLSGVFNVLLITKSFQCFHYKLKSCVC